MAVIFVRNRGFYGAESTPLVLPSEGPCFQWVQDKNALAASRNLSGPSGGNLCKKPQPLRSPSRGPVFALPDKKCNIISWVAKHTTARARPPERTCFSRFQVQKASICSWLTVFHAFPSKKVSRAGKNARNGVSFTR